MGKASFVLYGSVVAVGESAVNAIEASDRTLVLWVDTVLEKGG